MSVLLILFAAVWLGTSKAQQSPCVLEYSLDRYYALENCRIREWPTNFHPRDEDDDKINLFTVKNVILGDCAGWAAWLTDWHTFGGSFCDTVDVEASISFIRCLPENVSLIVARPESGPRAWLGLQAMALGNEVVESKLIDDSVPLKVRTLSLQELELTRIPAIRITVIDSLMLTGNRISRIATRDFDLMNLTGLRNLWLDSNLLCYVEASAFRTMSSLEHLDLSDNRLARMSIRFYIYNIVDQQSLPYNIIWNTTRWTYAQNCCSVVRRASECTHVVVVEIVDSAELTTTGINSSLTENTTSSVSTTTSNATNASERTDTTTVGNGSWTSRPNSGDSNGLWSLESAVYCVTAFFIALLLTFNVVLVREKRRSVRNASQQA